MFPGNVPALMAGVWISKFARSPVPSVDAVREIPIFINIGMKDLNKFLKNLGVCLKWLAVILSLMD